MTSPTNAVLDASLAFARIQSYSEQVQQPPPAIQVGSVLAGDDQAASPHLVSHAVWFAHTTAVDQLEGVRALTQDLRRVYPITQHTLLRSALENAATAVWLIAPGDRNVRLLRTLQVAAANLHESKKVQEQTGLTPPPPGRLPAERLREIEDLARASNLMPKDATRRVGYGEIVEKAGEAVDVDGGLLKLAWSVGSGFAHGRFWASAACLPHEDVTTGNDVVRQVRMTGSLEQVVLHASVALTLLDRAQTLFDGRRMIQQL